MAKVNNKLLLIDERFHTFLKGRAEKNNRTIKGELTTILESVQKEEKEIEKRG